MWRFRLGSDAAKFVCYGTAICVAATMLSCEGSDEDKEQKSADAYFEALELEIEQLSEFESRKATDPVEKREPPRVHTQDEEIELADLGVVFRRVRFEPAIDGNEHLFFSETEITNAAFARYLNDTDQWRDDTGLANAQKRWDAGFVRSDGTTSGQFSTGSPSIEVLRESSLWSEGSFPPGEDDFPVTFLTTAQATAFCDWLTKRYDLKGTFRLPSEQEWLYAAYGKDRDFPWGNDERDWKSEGTQTVKAKPETRTPDGLYGMWGNASELVSSRSNGYGGQIGKDEQPWITVWLGHNFRDERVRGKPAHPRQDYWGYTHSAKSRSDATGFRVVFDPES